MASWQICVRIMVLTKIHASIKCKTLRFVCRSTKKKHQKPHRILYYIIQHLKQYGIGWYWWWRFTLRSPSHSTFRLGRNQWKRLVWWSLMHWLTLRFSSTWSLTFTQHSLVPPAKWSPILEQFDGNTCSAGFWWTLCLVFPTMFSMFSKPLIRYYGQDTLWYRLNIGRWQQQVANNAPIQ